MSASRLPALLHERITIQTVAGTVDAIGGQTEGAPVTIAADLPAAVEALDVSMERLTVGQLRAAVTKKIRVRYREDLTDAMRVLWRSQTFEIGLVDVRPDVQETHLYCAEVNA